MRPSPTLVPRVSHLIRTTPPVHAAIPVHLLNSRLPAPLVTHDTSVVPSEINRGNGVAQAGGWGRWWVSANAKRNGVSAKVIPVFRLPYSIHRESWKINPLLDIVAISHPHNSPLTPTRPPTRP
ncbi:hypothetical protein EHS25_006924 [Saitozyma podzolica]|uniref:Uncharacterized protein n=1 Tax=Saitozyma podzolica TaxID=1890683 RepID=A0A427XR72_9TREE|nr:hypothetical protein EHS25_006924 [Saitozyma podzolica]